MVLTQAEQLLTEITPLELEKYSDYWNRIRPKTPEDVYNRWLFSFLSVHTTWQSNVRAFQKLKDRTWGNDKAKLQSLIVESGVGLTRIRTEGIWKFHNDFWEYPQLWIKHKSESWVEFRDRLSKRSFGIGLTKTAFSCEMIYPLEAEVVCLDAHILKIYEYEYRKKGAPGYTDYRKMENHWATKCKELKIPSPIARSIVWDKLLKQQTMDYWSYVFH